MLVQALEVILCGWNYVEQKRLLAYTLKLERERGNDRQVGEVLGYLSDANRMLKLRKEGIQQAEEALEIYERLGDVTNRAWFLTNLAWLLYEDGQLDTAEEVISRAANLLLEKGRESWVANLTVFLV